MTKFRLVFKAAPLLAALLIAVSAQFSFPLPATDIPQTAQTIAVLVSGSLLGPLRGAIAVVLYLLLGLVGLPVYSEGASGWTTLVGASAGYFAGFVLAAALTGYLRRALHKDVLWLLSMQMLAGHCLILVTGWLWLATSQGISEAFQAGVTPFIYGALVKSALGALLVMAYKKLARQ